MAYTYDDFMSAASSSGLLGEFSQSDLDTAMKYPEFGLSILSLKKDYHAATTPEQKLLANEAANELRSSYGNYKGGTDGSRYYSQGKIPGQIDNILDQMNSYGSFSYDVAAPVYNNQYAQQQQALLDQILNREDFSWSKETDPLWPVYKKQYLREGERATANTLAQASAASGGRASSFAVNAANQAGDYYATKLNDIIPALYQQAYDRYLNEYSMMQQDLGAVNTQEQMDYAKYLDSLGQYNTDRNFAYNQYLDDYSRLQSTLGALQSQDAVDYGRYLDNINLEMQRDQTAYDRAWNEDARAYDRQQDQQAIQQAQIDAILAAGGVPSEALLGGSGYTSEYVQALEDAYRREQAAKTAAKSGGNNGGNNGGNTTPSTPSTTPTTGISQTMLDTLKTKYPGGVVTNAANWESLVGLYGEEALAAAGFTNQTSGGTTTQSTGGNASVTNQTGSGWIRVPGYSRVTWQELEAMVERGEIIETYNPETKKYSYRKNNNYNG